MSNKFKIKAIPSLIIQAYYELLDDKGFKMAAALSYYSAFSLGPLLIIVIAIAGFFFGEDAAKGQIFSELKNLVGPDGAIMIETILKGAASKSAGIFAAVVSIILLVLGSIGVFLELQESLNIIWGVELKPGRGLWLFIRNRLISFSMVVAMGFLLMVSLIISSAISLVNSYMSEQFPSLLPLAFIFNNLSSLIVLTVMFSLIYKVLPDVVISWKYVWFGSVLTSILFTLGKYLISLYLGSSSFSSTYGAAASLVIIFVWIYYSGLILYFGAELTQVVRKRYNSQKLTPSKDGIIMPKVTDLINKAVNKSSGKRKINTG
ncbi:MAG TPA: YihY/virulence factor BrkB family protein [Ignavibacteria bacterium]|nr:YihY/virulence factor BrkB family protein [Ignavibacteria bacterium]